MRFFRELGAYSTLALCFAFSSGGRGDVSTALPTMEADIVVYAATPSGIAAAIEAAHRGKHVILLEPSRHVGGMSSGGLGTTDVYDMKALGGFVQVFFQTIRSIYGPAYSDQDAGGTRYEPHVAEQAFNQMLEQQKNLRLIYGGTLSAVNMSGNSVSSIVAKGGRPGHEKRIEFRAKVFIDASYEGDLMAGAHVSYTVGREAKSQYGEDVAGVQLPRKPDKLVIDPYVVPGDPASGLLPHIESITLGAYGSSDKSVVAYNYRLCISADPQNQIPFTAPADYDPEEFEALGRYAQALTASGTSFTTLDFLSLGWLPNNKADLNSSGFFSTDEVGESAAYPNASPAERAAIAAEHKRYIQGLLYFLITDWRIPPTVRSRVASLGLCKDEFTDNERWPRQLYVREARRMVGTYVVTQSDVQSETTIPDSIGLGGYGFDCHLTNRVAVNGATEAEGNFQSGTLKPYPISYRCLTPKASEATNLLVTVAISASHAAYESLRVEPTYMIMGQAAGAAASLAIDENVSVQDVNYQALAAQSLADGMVLTPPQ